VLADRERLSQIVENLLLNAARHGAPPCASRQSRGRPGQDRGARLGAWRGGDGPTRLFERFVTGRPGGSGLGLYIVRELARAQGGDAPMTRMTTRSWSPSRRRPKGRSPAPTSSTTMRHDQGIRDRDIEVTDPDAYEDYKRLSTQARSCTAPASWCAAAQPSGWRATGSRSGWCCSSSTTRTPPGAGTLPRVRRARSVRQRAADSSLVLVSGV
jgi:hypothetical protein